MWHLELGGHWQERYCQLIFLPNSRFLTLREWLHFVERLQLTLPFLMLHLMRRSSFRELSSSKTFHTLVFEPKPWCRFKWAVIPLNFCLTQSTDRQFLRFLVAYTRLYRSLCQLVGPSVPRSLGRSVRRSRCWNFFQKAIKTASMLLPTRSPVRDWFCDVYGLVGFGLTPSLDSIPSFPKSDPNGIEAFGHSIIS